MIEKVNFHTHTKRCHHAYGEDEEYVQAAIKAGYKVLGFSDHTPWKYDSDYKAHMRMDLSEFDDYYNHIKELQEKYADQIKILIGLEAEYFPPYMDWYQEFIKKYNLDYVIFGNHYHYSDEDGMYYGYACNEDANLYQYLEDVKAGVEAGIYSYLAHPDLFMRGRDEFDEVARQVSYELCEFCKAHNVPLEYNLAGMRVGRAHNKVEYPYPDFWKIASEVGNEVIIGVDAHSPNDLLDDYYYQRALKELKALDMPIIDHISLNKF